MQSPAREQASPIVVQSMHWAPAVPQASSIGVLHVAPEQQPDGQVSGVHITQAPCGQLCIAGHCVQRAPPVPHTPGAVPAWQASFASQQPLGHEAALQTHLPPEQTWPTAHAASPHAHVLVAAQASP